MSLYECPDCEHDVSESAKECPMCGCTKLGARDKKKMFSVVLILVGILAMLVWGDASAMEIVHVIGSELHSYSVGLTITLIGICFYIRDLLTPK